MEILVVDDASPSDLSGLVREAGRGRVRYLRNASKLGLYPSTNAAIEATSGRFVHILHDDDWVANGFYRKMREAIEACPEAGVAFCQYEVFYERSGRTWSPPPFRASAGLMDRNFLIRLATECPLNLPAVVFGRETFERVGLFRTDLPMMADWEWYVRSAVQCGWLHLPERLATWRTHHAHQLTAQLVELLRVPSRFPQDARDLRPDVASRRRGHRPARGAGATDEALSRRRGRMPA